MKASSKSYKMMPVYFLFDLNAYKMSESTLKKRIQLLTVFMIFGTFIFSGLFIWLFNKQCEPKLDELTLKRLNLVGEDGSLRMVISNEDRQHAGRIDGENLPDRDRPAGIIFFDDNGNECGGLVYAERSRQGKVNKMMSFTMDNYKNDQVVQLINNETYKDGQAMIHRGLVINEFPVGADMGELIPKLERFRGIKDSAVRHAKIDSLFEKDGSKRRLFIGRTNENQSGIFLFDKKGRPRMQIFVDSLGNPHLLALDKYGQQKQILKIE